MRDRINDLTGLLVTPKIALLVTNEGHAVGSQAEGERPGAGVYAGALLCLVAVVLASSAGHTSAVDGPGQPGRGRAVAYGIASGASFGLFFLLIRNAGQSGTFWPVVAGRVGELAIVLVAAAVLRRGLLPRGTRQAEV